MQLCLEQSTFETIYSSSAKLIVSDRDRNILSGLSFTNRLDVYLFKLDSKSNSGCLTPADREIASELSESKIAPNFCLGLVSFSNLGHDDLMQLRDWWSNQGSAHSIPAIFKIDSQQEKTAIEAAVWQQLYLQMEGQNQATASRIATLQRQYLGLRKLHEDMQNAFSTVEAYLSQAKLPPIQLVFDTQITDRLVEPAKINNSNCLILKQLFPLSSRGLGAIELHIAKQDVKAEGDLQVSLKACEDKTAIAVWKIPYQHLSVGWLALDLPNINLGRKREIELLVEWQTRLGPAPSLSLSKQQPIPESRAYNDDITLESSLAIRIWHGLPGTRKVTSPYLILTSQQNEKISVQLGELGQRAMTRVQEVTPNLPTDSFEHIQVFENGAKIMTHPRSDGTPTIAMLPHCFPATANQLTASLITNHEAAGTIEYAIAIISPETEPQQALDHSTALIFSDWIAVEPKTPRQITVNLSQPVAVNCHIVIAAKFPPGNPSDFAWAHWLNFHAAQVSLDPVESTQPGWKEDPSSDNIDLPVEELVSVSSTPNFRVENPASSVEYRPRENISSQASGNSSQIQLRDASLGLQQSEFTKVQLIEQENKIQVYPTKDGDTIAVLANAIASKITKVKSTVCTENEAASAINYAIAVIADNDNTLARLAISSPTSALGFSGWQLVEANTPHTIELDLDIPTEDTCHLVLATRLPKDSSQSNAWARWINIEFDQ